MYSAVAAGVKQAKVGISGAIVLTVVAGAIAQPLTSEVFAGCVPNPALTTLFTPPRPQLGRYEVCTTPEPIAKFARRDWEQTSATPLDVFGTSGTYDRSRLSRLYGGRDVSVARGWIQNGRVFESITLVSPYPDASLAHLLQGTLVVRFIICCT